MNKINKIYMNKINYEALYEKIFEKKANNKTQLMEFIQLVTEMHNNNDSNPLHYTTETMYEYAKIFNRLKELKRMTK